MKRGPCWLAVLTFTWHRVEQLLSGSSCNTMNARRIIHLLRVTEEFGATFVFFDGCCPPTVTLGLDTSVSGFKATLPTRNTKSLVLKDVASCCFWLPGPWGSGCTLTEGVTPRIFMRVWNEPWTGPLGSPHDKIMRELQRTRREVHPLNGDVCSARQAPCLSDEAPQRRSGVFIAVKQIIKGFLIVYNSCCPSDNVWHL